MQEVQTCKYYFVNILSVIHME